MSVNTIAKKYRYLRADCIWLIRNTMRFLKKNIKFTILSREDLNILYFVIDPEMRHSGMVDRFKGIINAYYFSKQNGYAFRIIYKTPFPLENYLQPNKVNWIADFPSLKFSIFNTRFINECEWHKLPKLKKNRQYHIYNYIGNGIGPFVSKGEEKCIWRELFHELFKPTPALCNVLNTNIASIGAPYIAIHARFVNTLENFEYNLNSTGRFTLGSAQQNGLIERCRNGILKIIKNNGGGYNYLVLSDSKRFLNAIQDMPVVILDTDKIGHTSFTNDEDTVQKTFLDFFLLSRAKAIYRIMAPELYSSSCFALYASIIGDAPFNTINV